MLPECPHCHLSVLASAEGVCPNCRKSVHDRTGARPDLTRLRIRERAPMPACCHQCGARTERVVKVLMNSGEGVANPALRFLATLVVGLFCGLLALARLGPEGIRSARTVTLHMPQCDSCARGGPPRPLDVEFDEFAMTFLVHMRFKEAFSRG